MAGGCHLAECRHLLDALPCRLLCREYCNQVLGDSLGGCLGFASHVITSLPLRMRDLSPEVVNRPVWVLRAAEGMWYEATVVALGVGMRECTVVYAESGNR